jgi:septal ring factor EnvC (AmiA/AmiB activator)
VSAPDRYQRPLLRYKRLGGGLRREDVEFALAELRLALRQLDNDLASLRNRNRELERELDVARTKIESFHGREHDLSDAISEALRRAADIEVAANARARDRGPGRFCRRWRSRSPTGSTYVRPTARSWSSTSSRKPRRLSSRQSRTASPRSWNG